MDKGRVYGNVRKELFVMHELTGKIRDISRNFKNNKIIISFEANEKSAAEAAYDDLKDAERLMVKLGKYRAKRSLDANAYFFCLLDKLAEKLNMSKIMLYKNYIKELGGVSETVCVQNKAVDKLVSGWEHNGLGWQTETYESKIPNCTNVILYYGSSTYDTAQMSRLISLLVDDCKEQGIETKTPDELARLISLWGGEK